MDDAALQKQAQAGDATAFTTLASRYYPALCRHATYLTHDADVAQDVVQEALLKAYLNIHKYDPARSYSTWAYKIVTNAALDYLRKKKDASLDDLEEVPADTEDPLIAEEDAALRAEQIATLQEALTVLPTHYKTVINLYYWENKSYKEIAEIMHKPLGTIKIWLHRAKRQLKEACNG